MRQLKCPQCHSTFTNVTIAKGAVCCPECGEEIFRYKLEGEDDLTPKAFMELMDTRGNAAGKASMKWFPSKVRVKQTLAAGMFIAYLWPHLAQTFVREPEGEPVE